MLTILKVVGDYLGSKTAVEKILKFGPGENRVRARTGRRWLSKQSCGKASTTIVDCHKPWRFPSITETMQFEEGQRVLRLFFVGEGCGHQMRDALMDLSYCYIVLPNVEAAMSILKVYAVLISCYLGGRISETRKVSWRRKLKLHTTLPFSTPSSTVS